MSFPRHILDPRHGMTLPDRAGDWAKDRLETKLPGIQAGGRAPVVEGTEPFIYRTLVSAATVDYTRLSVLSVLRACPVPPRIELCTDGSVEPEALSTVMAGHGVTASVQGVDAVLASLTGPQAGVLKAFADSFVWGKKFVFAMGSGGNRPVVFADNDVLWMESPVTGLNLEGLPHFMAGTDCAYGYDPGFLEWMGEGHRETLRNSPPVCAGITLLPAGFELPGFIIDYISGQVERGTVPGHFFEQTLVGLMANVGGGRIPYARLPTCGPRTALRPSYRGEKWVGAHYAGPSKRQFWRDAWSLFRSTVPA